MRRVAKSVEEYVMSTSTNSSAAALRPYLSPITGSPGDYDRLLERVGDARLVLVGDETPSGLKGNQRPIHSASDYCEAVARGRPNSSASSS
jgi:hypothetical protein